LYAVDTYEPVTGMTKAFRRLRSAARAARCLGLGGGLAPVLLGLLLGLGLGLLLRGGLVGGLLLGGGLRVDLLREGVADGDGLGQAGLLHSRVVGGEGGGGEASDDTGRGERGDAGDLRGGARDTARATVLPGGTGERHGVADPFLPSRLPG
jgi:hypothetical protein